MAAVAIVLVIAFLIMLLMNTPIAVAIGLSAFLAILAANLDAPSAMIAAKMANGVNSFSLLAIPFFVLSGYLMGKGGMARRLIDFAAVLVGRLPGGLAYVNTLTCMLFGSISGSAAAAVSSVGGFMIPEMNRKGYGREFNVAVTTTAATTGLMIPPSNIMIVYCVVASGVSVAAMFMAGVLPGIVTGLAIMIVCGIISAIRGYRGEDDESQHIAPKIKMLALLYIALLCVVPLAIWQKWLCWPALDFGLGVEGKGFALSISPVAQTVIGLTLLGAYMFKAFRSALPTLFLIVIIIGGILSGIFSATEAAAIAVVYAFFISVVVYREIKLTQLPEIFLRTGVTTAVVMLLIGASSSMSWIMTMANIPQTVSAALLGLSENPIIILLTINLLLLIVGTFMDMTPAVLIFTPIFLPVVTELGMNPVHFGVMMIANLCIGLCTPPVGTCLFIGCGVGKTSIARVTKPMLPFFGAMAVALMLITFVPWLSMWLPKLLGLVE